MLSVHSRARFHLLRVFFGFSVSGLLAIDGAAGVALIFGRAGTRGGPATGGFRLVSSLMLIPSKVNGYKVFEFDNSSYRATVLMTDKKERGEVHSMSGNENKKFTVKDMSVGDGGGFRERVWGVQDVLREKSDWFNAGFLAVGSWILYYFSSNVHMNLNSSSPNQKHELPQQWDSAQLQVEAAIGQISFVLAIIVTFFLVLGLLVASRGGRFSSWWRAAWVVTVIQATWLIAGIFFLGAFYVGLTQ